MSQELVDKAMDAYRLAHMIMEGKFGPAVAEAIPHLAIAADCWRQALRSRQQAECLMELGRLHQQCDDPHAAEQAFEEALRIYKETNDQGAMAGAGMHAGLALRAQGRYDMALGYLERSVGLAREAGDMLMSANILMAIASLLLDTSRPAEALGRALEAMPLFNKLSKRTEAAQAYELMAMACDQTGDTSTAASYFETAMTAKQGLGDMKGAARTLGRCADMWRHRSEFDKALAAYQRAMSIHQMRGDQAMIAQTCGNMGTVHALRRQHEEAIALYQRCYQLSEQVGERAAMAQALYNIGCVFADTSREPDARVEFDRALVLAQQAANHPLCDRILLGLIDLHGRRGAAAEIKACNLQRAEILAAMGQDKECVQILDDLAGSAIAAEDWTAAVAAQTKAMTMLEGRLPRAELARRRLDLATLQMKLGEHRGAIDTLTAALSASDADGEPGLVIRILRQLGQSELQVGASADALAHYRRCQELCERGTDRNALALALVGVGNAYGQMNEPTQAKEALDRAASLKEALGDQKGTATIRRATTLLDHGSGSAPTVGGNPTSGDPGASPTP